MIASIRPHDKECAYFAIRRSTTATVSALRWRVASAVRRPIHGFTSPATIRAHSAGSRCRRSNASPTSRSAADDEVARTTPSSAGANSATPGVPSPPNRTSFSDPGSSGPVARASSLCRSAQRAAVCNNRTSPCSTTARACSAAASVAGSSSALRSVSNMCSILPRHVRQWPEIFRLVYNGFRGSTSPVATEILLLTAARRAPSGPGSGSKRTSPWARRASSP